MRKKIKLILAISFWAPLVAQAECTPVFSTDPIISTRLTTSVPKKPNHYHLGFPSLVRFNNKFYLAIRESQDLTEGHHKAGRILIYTSSDNAQTWQQVSVINPPKLGQDPNDNEDPLNANDVRDFTLSVKPGVNGVADKLGLTFVAANQDVESKKSGHLYKLRFNLYTELTDPINNTWSAPQRILHADNRFDDPTDKWPEHDDYYWFYSTKWKNDKSYSFALVSKPVTFDAWFGAGGIALFSSSDGVNYLPHVVTEGQNVYGDLDSPYANSVSLATRELGQAHPTFSFDVGANETDFEILNDGSLVAIGRKRDNEKSYFFGYADNVNAKWSFKEIGFALENNVPIQPDDFGIHGMELLQLPNGMVVAAYRRLNVRNQNGQLVEEFCTVLSRLNIQSGELTEIGAIAGIDHFDIGYPAILVEDGHFYLVQYNRYDKNGPFIGRGSYSANQTFAEISLMKISLNELYEKISATMHAELEPIRQLIQD